METDIARKEMYTNRICKQDHLKRKYYTGCPRKNGALACYYSRANAPFFLGHLVYVV